MNSDGIISDIRYYSDKRVRRLFLLGLSSGFPWVLIGSALSLWLKEAGLSRSAIGYAGAIFAVYSINFLWAPVIDRYAAPGFARLGRRKSWIIICLLLMAAASILVAQTNPVLNAQHTVLLCLLIALASATQDIAIDAYRIDSIPKQETALISAAAAMTTAGWWTGFSGLGAIAFYLADIDGIVWSDIYLAACILFLAIAAMVAVYEEENIRAWHSETRSRYSAILNHTAVAANSLKWLSASLLALPFLLVFWLIGGAPGIEQRLIYSVYFVPTLFFIGVSAITLAVALLAPGDGSLDENSTQPPARIARIDKFCAYLIEVIAIPFASFIQKNGLKISLNIIAFIFLFKIGEAFLGRMSIIFYKEIGFSTSDIATYSKLMNWGVTIIVSLVGGLFTIRFGMLKGLLIAGIAMASSNLMFSMMALAGSNELLFAATVIVDGITSAWSNVAFVAFLSYLCDKRFSASQYALFASIGTLGRTILGSGSGTIVDALNGNWAIFFLLTALAVIPALLVLVWLGKQNKVFSGMDS